MHRLCVRLFVCRAIFLCTYVPVHILERYVSISTCVCMYVGYVYAYVFTMHTCRCSYGNVSMGMLVIVNIHVYM